MTEKSKKIKVDKEDLRQQIKDLTLALQRERADAINVRRRHDEQVASLRDGVKASVIEQLLPAIDNLERALKHVPKDIAHHDYVKGVQGVVKQFEKTLEDLGIKKIETKNQIFDPNLHEAVSMEDQGGKKEKITEELQSGYMLANQVIRHAMVKVKKA